MIVQAILRAHRGQGKDDSLWGVARVEVVEAEADDGLRPGTELSAVGGLIRAAAVGELLRLEGELVNHPKWGRQLQVERQESLGIQREADAWKWLERLQGVGPVLARAIHDKFQGKVLEVLRAAPDGPDPLLEVDGIGSVLAKTIRESWSSIGAQGSPEDLAYLDGIGLGRWEVNQVIAAAKKRELTPREFLESDPYALMEGKGFGFVRADNVALRAGVSREAPARLDAAVVHQIEETCATDTVVPVGRLVDDVAKITNVSKKLICDAIYRVARSGRGVVVGEDEAGVELVHPQRLLEAEREIYEWATRGREAAPEGRPAGPVPREAPAPPVPVEPAPCAGCGSADGAGRPTAHQQGCPTAYARPMARAEVLKRIERQRVACELLEIPHFAPADGVCFSCRRQIYELDDGTAPVTSCPSCARSFCD